MTSQAPRPLHYGGEVQYFRVRDRRWDPHRTRRAWGRALDAVAEAGMDLVSTYVPWDFHAPGPGVFDFEGTRDLDAYLRMCAERGLRVLLKPGPYINSEWPYGFGSFGALPAWVRQRHRGALLRRPSGKFLSFHPAGRARDRQCDYLHPGFLAEVGRWFEALAPLVRRWSEAGVLRWLQLDNETNYFWDDRYRVDLGNGPSPPADRPEAHRLWFEEAHRRIHDYLLRLRRTWEALGVREPAVRFLTNDSPHPFWGRALVLPHPAGKGPAGHWTLDLYNRQFPWTRCVEDYPYMTDAWARLAPRPLLCAEAQGGIFQLPLGIPIPVSPRVSERLALKLIGHGAEMVCFYLLHGGMNLDGSSYSFQAPILPDGRRTARYDLLARIGRRLVVPYRPELGRLFPPRRDVAVAVSGRDRVPRPGPGPATQRVHSVGPAALVGWLARGGMDPEVVDVEEAADLSPFRLVVHLAEWGPSSAGAARLRCAGRVHAVPWGRVRAYASGAYFRLGSRRLAADAAEVRRVAAAARVEPSAWLEGRGLAWIRHAPDGGAWVFAVNDEGRPRVARVVVPALPPGRGEEVLSGLAVEVGPRFDLPLEPYGVAAVRVPAVASRRPATLPGR